MNAVKKVIDREVSAALCSQYVGSAAGNEEERKKPKHIIKGYCRRTEREVDRGPLTARRDRRSRPVNL